MLEPVGSTKTFEPSSSLAISGPQALSEEGHDPFSHARPDARQSETGSEAVAEGHPRERPERAHSFRFVNILPNASPSPTLRDMQLAIAREFGLDGWSTLKRMLEHRAPSMGKAAKSLTEAQGALPVTGQAQRTDTNKASGPLRPRRDASRE